MTTSLLLLEENSEINNKDCIEHESNLNFTESEESTDSASEISLSNKIIYDSNQKRVCERMMSLQNSINNLKKQFQQEKQHWKDDYEKLTALIQQQKNVRCMCSMSTAFSFCHNSCNCENASRTNSIYSLISRDCSYSKQDASIRPQRLEQMIELFNYQQKLTETENMCNLELIKLKQNLRELKHLEASTLDWNKEDNKCAEEID